MPIFQDPERQRFYDLWSDDHHRHHHHHKNQEREEESRNPASSWDVFGHADYGGGVSNSDVTSLGDDLRTPGPHFSKLQPSDRGELIQHLKNDASTWVQNQLVCLDPQYINCAPTNRSSRTIQMPTIPQTRVIRHTIIHGWMKGPISSRMPGINSRQTIRRSWLHRPI